MSSALEPIPPDDPKRSLTVAQPENLPHIGLVGDTYTITVTGEQTAGRFCVIDMHIPPGGGPPPHRHDFEETFILLEGQMEATFRGQKSTLRAGETLNIPANAPHQFHNASGEAVRIALYLLSCRAGKILFGGGSSGRHSHHTSAQAL
jgi:quercetin dioxygenase-like cupin family protein